MLQAVERRLSVLESLLLPPPPVAVPTATDLFTRAVGRPDPWQVEVLTSAAPRLALNCARQAGKSAVVACLALHEALTVPDSLTLLVSPSLRQSMELFRKVARAFAALGAPMPLEAESKLAYELRNGSRLIALPGQEGTVRGYSAVDMVVIDEASRVQDELFDALMPMLGIKPEARLVTLSTPAGKRGWWFREWEQGEDWQRIRIDVTRCPRIAAGHVERERRSRPRAVFEQEYLCVFHDTEDAVFRFDDVQACVWGEVVPFLQRRAACT